MIQGNHPQESSQELPWSGAWACVLVSVMGVTAYGYYKGVRPWVRWMWPANGYCPSLGVTGWARSWVWPALGYHRWVCLYLVEHSLCMWPVHGRDQSPVGVFITCSAPAVHVTRPWVWPPTLGCVYTLLSTFSACHPPVGVTTSGCVYTLLSTHCACAPPVGVTTHPWVCLYLVEHPLCMPPTHGCNHPPLGVFIPC